MDIDQLAVELCSCGKCKKPVQSPRSLPCLHVFCESCLKNHIATEIQQCGNATNDTSFPCPKCSVKTKIPANTSFTATGNYANLFPEDSFVVKLNEVISAYSAEKTCKVCELKSVSIPAVEWCLDCYDSLCEPCANLHVSDSKTSEHVVIALEEMRNLSLDTIMQQKRTVPCSEHGREIMNLFCPDCRVPMCIQCAALSHRKCKRYVNVADAVKFHEEEVEDVLDGLQILESADKTSPARSDAASVLEETLTAATETIKSTAADLIDKITKSERELLDRVQTLGQELRPMVASKKSTKAESISLIRSGAERMDAMMNFGSDVEILSTFVDLKKNISKLEYDEVGPGDDVLVRVNFNIDKTTKYFLRDFQTLGEVEQEDCQVDEGLSSWGVTCTSHDHIIVADCRNRRVQKFNIEGILIDHIQVSEEPRDLTTVAQDEVAITIMKKNIFFVSTSRQMRLLRKVKTEKQYDSISKSLHLDNLLVSSMQDREIDVIDMRGAVLKSFNADGTGEAIFKQPRYVTFSHEDNYVITDVEKNCIMCITQDGQLLFRYEPDGSHVLRHPQDVCIDNIGNVFIADYSNSRIHLITSDGYFQRFIVDRTCGLVHPVAMHITPSNKLIIVQSDGMVKLFTYE